MRVIIDKRKEDEQTLENVDKLEIWISDNKCFRISNNGFGELVINKQTCNTESETIIIKPSVSNVIH